MKSKINKAIITLQIKAMQKINQVKAVIKSNDGLSHTVEILLWVLGAAAVVAVIIAGVILLVKNDVFPMFTEKMKEIFNMK